MNTVEQVLVVERSAFDRVGSFQGIAFDTDRYLAEFFAKDVLRFMPRPEAEQDPAYKQIIPYVLMTDGHRFLAYVRGVRAGEQRLVGLRSIGIGGHINPADDLPLFSADFREAYRAAVEREVAEEVSVAAAHTERFVALLNDDSTDVGRVHLGIVHLWRLESPDVRKREQMITQLSFMTPAELRGVRDSLESWSRFCVDHLEALAGMTPSGASAPKRNLAGTDVR